MGILRSEANDFMLTKVAVPEWLREVELTGPTQAAPT